MRPPFLPMPDEDAEQAAFLRRFQLEFPGIWFYAIPNGGKRNKRVAQKLKAAGVRRGVPDLCFPAWFLYIEMKRSDGGKGLSTDQKLWKVYLERVGYTVLVCDGRDDAIRQMKEFANQRRLR